jgi:ABC-2 type transport system permease protein
MTPRGVIYDQGYRRYEGRYLGRSYAIWSLIVSDLKRALGVKKSAWYRAFLWFFLVVILVQTVFAFFFNAIAELGGSAPLALTHPHSFLFDIASIIFLFLSAMVAPDLLCYDRKFKVLSLYLVRPIELYDYLFAKGAVLFGFLALVALVPQLGIFITKAFTAPDAIKYFIEHSRDFGALFASSLLYAVFYASLAMAVSSLTAQRNYATGAIIAAPILLGVASTLLFATSKNTYWQLLDIDGLPGGVKNALFGVSYSTETGVTINEQVISLQPLEWWIYAIALGAVVALSLSVVLFSYAKEHP